MCREQKTRSAQRCPSPTYREPQCPAARKLEQASSRTSKGQDLQKEVAVRDVMGAASQRNPRAMRTPTGPDGRNLPAGYWIALRPKMKSRLIAGLIA